MFELLLTGGMTRAQVGTQEQGQAKRSVVSQSQPKPQPVADATVPLLEGPLTLADFPDMEPRPQLKDKLGYLTQFIQNNPVDGAPATERTEVYLGRTKTALYIVFLCFDQHPELIQNTSGAAREHPEG